MANADCAFCRIVRLDAPAHRVYEDDAVLAFLDIRPVSQGHTLVVPKPHSADLAELPLPLGAHLFTVAHRLALAFRGDVLAADGANVVINDGRAAFQTVPHTHIHVVPRWSGDRLRFVSQFLTRRPRDLEGTAELVRAAMNGGVPKNDNAPSD
jgi:histidine triad (HIT) family protein